MSDLTGYQLGEVLSESRHSVVVRARREGPDAQPVVVKMMHHA